MAESKLVAKLNRDFLECGICLDRFQKPCGLPCLHCFCHECLERLCKGKTHILCPNCKRPTTVPEEGVAGFPAHFMVNSLQETVDMEKIKGEELTVGVPICSNCDLLGKEASVRCLDCQEFFCKTCHVSHDAFKAMKRHKVISIEDLRCGKAMLTVASTQDQMCEEHEDEIKRFYCETCKKPVCRDCSALDHRQHEYVSLKDAAKKQRMWLQELTTKCEVIQKRYKDAIQETENIEGSLSKAVKEANEMLDGLRKEHIEQVETMFKKHKNEVLLLEEQRTEELYIIKENLLATSLKVQNALDLSTKVRQIGSHYDVTSVYSTLSTNLQELSTANPVPANKSLGYVDIKILQTKPEIADNVRVLGRTREGTLTLVKADPTHSKRADIPQSVKEKQWKQTNQFSTTPNLKHPYGIAVHSDGNVAVTNGLKKIVQFSQQGLPLCSFAKGSFDAYLCDIDVTRNNSYVLPGKNKILLFNNQNDHISTIAISDDVNTKPSNPKTLAVDSRGWIIAGLDDNTISIYNGDGGLESKFATSATPRRLAVTSKEVIANTLHDDTLQVMDYFGNNVKVVKRPLEVKKWSPWYVCCSSSSKQGEIFVVNDGEPKAVYKYTADGDQCLGCVITGLRSPRGIAVTEDGQVLFVTEHSERLVKIFRKQ